MFLDLFVARGTEVVLTALSLVAKPSEKIAVDTTPSAP